MFYRSLGSACVAAVVETAVLMVLSCLQMAGVFGGNSSLLCGKLLSCAVVCIGATAWFASGYQFSRRDKWFFHVLSCSLYSLVGLCLSAIVSSIGNDVLRACLSQCWGARFDIGWCFAACFFLGPFTVPASVLTSAVMQRLVPCKHKITRLGCGKAHAIRISG